MGDMIPAGKLPAGTLPICRVIDHRPSDSGTVFTGKSFLWAGLAEEPSDQRVQLIKVDWFGHIFVAAGRQRFAA